MLVPWVLYLVGLIISRSVQPPKVRGYLRAHPAPSLQSNLWPRLQPARWCRCSLVADVAHHAATLRDNPFGMLLLIAGYLVAPFVLVFAHWPRSLWDRRLASTSRILFDVAMSLVTLALLMVALSWLPTADLQTAYFYDSLCTRLGLDSGRFPRGSQLLHASPHTPCDVYALLTAHVCRVPIGAALAIRWCHPFTSSGRRTRLPAMIVCTSTSTLVWAISDAFLSLTHSLECSMLPPRR